MTEPQVSAPKIYLFVDASFVRKLVQDTVCSFSGLQVQVNWKSLLSKFKASRVFIYDCLDDIRRLGETEAELKARVDMQESSNAQISELPGYFVRLGALSGSGTRRRQKEVDVQLAVDMLLHSQNKSMDIAPLLAGDRDFRPVVEALVNQGTVVHVISARRSASKALTNAADLFHALTVDELWKLTDGPQRDTDGTHFPYDYTVFDPLPPGEKPIDFQLPLTNGRFPLGFLSIVKDSNNYVLRAIISSETYVFPKFWRFHDLVRLKSFAELEFGTIIWN